MKNMRHSAACHSPLVLRAHQVTTYRGLVRPPRRFELATKTCTLGFDGQEYRPDTIYTCATASRNVIFECLLGALPLKVTTVTSDQILPIVSHGRVDSCLTLARVSACVGSNLRVRPATKNAHSPCCHADTRPARAYRRARSVARASTRTTGVESLLFLTRLIFDSPNLTYVSG